MSFDDGYTETFNGIHYRRLLKQCREYVSQLVTFERWEEVDGFVFRSPYLIDSGTIDKAMKHELFEQLMTNPDEEADLQNLIDGVKLYCEEPLLAVRDCDTCKKWWFNEDTRKIARYDGKELQRPAHARVSCETDAGCRKGHHLKPLGLSDKNWKAVNHYTEWKAVGCPHPECPVMRRNWKWIELSFQRYGHPALHAGVGGSTAG